jgi:hypothetical protein
MATAIIKIATIHCNQLTERDDDEIYCEFSAHYEGDTNPINDRLPYGDKRIWKIKQKETLALNLDVFTGKVDKPLTFTLKLKEQDLVGRLSGTTLMDDYIGSFKIRISPDFKVQWEEGEATNYLGEEANNLHHFEMTGSKAFYRMEVYFKLI